MSDQQFILLSSGSNNNPAQFQSTLCGHLLLHPNAEYECALTNCSLVSNWNTMPPGVSCIIDVGAGAVNLTLPPGNYTLQTIETYISEYVEANAVAPIVTSDFSLESIEATGKVRVNIGSNGLALTLTGIAPLLGFVNPTVISAPSSDSPNIATIDTVKLINVGCSLVDGNNVFSDVCMSQSIRSATLPLGLRSWEHFDLCASSEIVWVKCVANSISNISINLTDQNGAILLLNKDVQTYFTISIRRVPEIETKIQQPNK